MDVAIDIVAFVLLVAAGIVAGGQLFCLVSVLPAMPGWPREMSAIVHRDALTDRPDHVQRPFAVISVISAATVIVLMILDDDSWVAIAFLAVGLTLAVVSGAVSSREWPINEEIKSWGNAPKLDRYAELRRIWDTRHARRTWLSLAGLAAFVVGILVSHAS
jgi:hypothetical protein